MEDEDSVAIVGFACRFPGADDVDEFWKLLANGECHIDVVPQERWDVNDTSVKDSDESWKECASYAGLIDEHDRWDNKFFGVSDTEAAWMNPQQCLALEVTHSALESGGFTKKRIKGSNTGVYIGVMNDDFLLGLPNARDEFNNFLVTGLAPSITSNRISYHYDLHGPCMTLDTACSSALVSVHLGCQAIRTGECDMTICGGVNSILTPVNFIALNKAKMISPTGKSHTFSKNADGYVRGEGCGIVILKSHKKAKQDGDRIFGIVHTGCNQDGNTNTPITAPSSQQQLSLLKNIYNRYKIDPALIQHIEAHGTGTPVGDPLEVKALANFFAPCVRKDIAIPIGSVKTNIGHLESSAGTAGLIKSILMMQNEKIVPSLHFEEGKENPDIDFKSIPFTVATSVVDWPPYPEGYRICCVNSFGFGGTNCHAIVKQFQYKKKAQKHSEDAYFIVCISGTSIPAVKKTALHLRQKLSSNNYDIADISYTSLLKRDQYRFRMTYIATSCNELATEITSKENAFDQLVSVDSKDSNLVFLFCGVGTLWKGTCNEMLNTNQVFRLKFVEVDKAIYKYANLSILKEVQNQSDDLPKDPFKGPLVIFACQVAMFHTLTDLGLQPDIIVGQSVGEVAAAYAAKCLTFEDAVKVIYYRSSISSKAQGGGMMVVGKCDVAEIQKMCDDYDGKLCIAVYSSEEACVVSGDKEHIVQLKENLEKTNPNILLKELDVGCAYHSHHMNEVSKLIEEKLTSLKSNTPSTQIISTLTGRQVQDNSMSTPSYWTRNLREPVLLKEAVFEAVHADKSNVILELGPRPVIKAHLKNITNQEATSMASLNQPNECKTFMQALANLHQRGFTINWEKTFVEKGNVLDIPRYKFNRSGVLIGSNAIREGLRASQTGKDSHPFVRPKSLSRQYSVTISTTTTPYVFEHVVDNRNIAPGAIHAEIAFEIATRIMQLPNSLIDVSLQFIRPVFVGKGKKIILETVPNEDEYAFEIKKKQEVVCKVNLRRARKLASQRISISDLKQKCQIYKTSYEFYEMLHQLGFQYGDSLRVIDNCWVSETEYIAEMKLSDACRKTFHQMNLHPIALDGALQTIALCYLIKPDFDSNVQEERPIPVRIRSLVIHLPLEENMLILGKLIKSEASTSSMDLMIVNEIGDVLVEIEGYEVQNIAPGAQPKSLDDKLYKMKWHMIEVQNLNIKNSEKPNMCISFSPEASIVLEKQLTISKSHISCLPFKLKEYNASILFEELQWFIDTVFQSVANIGKILFYPGLIFSSDNQESDVIFNMIKTSCVILTKLIQLLIRENIDIEVYVLTKQTQPKSHAGEIENSCFNVIGSELWGMGRCLHRERTFTRLYLIDFEHDEDLHFVQNIMSDSSKTEIWRRSHEYKIDGNKIYINQITRSTAVEPSFRMNSFNKNETVEIRTNNPDTIDKLFMLPMSQYSDIIPPQNVKLVVEDIYLNDTWSPLTKTNATEDPDPWKYRRKDGHELLPCEITGSVSAMTGLSRDSQSCFNKSRISPLDFKQQKFITCFPKICANSLILPLDCIIDLSLFPTYRPGILAELVMYFSMAVELDRKMPMLISYDKNLNLNMFFLKSIIEFNKRKIIAVIEISNIKSVTFTGNFQVVVLTKNVQKLEKLMKYLENRVRKMVSFTNFVTKSTERHIRHSYPHVELQLINTDEIGTHRRLSNGLKGIKSWLSSKATKMSWSVDNERLPTSNYLITFSKNVDHDSNMIDSYTLPKATTKENLFSKKATYVIVGGLSGLGWEIVDTIARMGGGGIAILARRSPNDEQQMKINELMLEFNCKIQHIAADISDLSSVQKAFDTINGTFENLIIKGIFHGAAVVEDAIIVHMSEDKIDTVLRPKVLGTWNLHLVSKDLNLDYFVLHSSVSSAFGNSGQTNYGAGNSFKDAVAFFRRSNGLAGQTINWGALRLGLLEKYQHVEKHLNAQGYISLEKPDVITCLLYTLSANSVQEICGLFDWTKIVRHAADMIHLTSRLGPILVELNLVDIFSTDKKSAIINIDHEELLKLSPNEQLKKIVGVICLIAADVCAVDASVVQISTNLTSIGIDSMKGMAFIDAVYEHISCKIPVISVLDPDSSVESISNLILHQVHSGSAATGYVPVEKIKRLEIELKKDKLPLNAIEDMFFEKHQNNENKPFHFTQLTLEFLNDLFDIEQISKCFSYLYEKYPILSSVYFVEDGVAYHASEDRNIPEIEKEIGEDKNFVFIPTITDNDETCSLFETKINLIVLDDDCQMEKSDCERVRLFQSKLLAVNVVKKESKMRQLILRFNSLRFDLKGIEHLIKELYTLVEKHESSEKHYTVDLTINNKLVEEQLQTTDSKISFWTPRVNKMIKPVYFAHASYSLSTEYSIHVVRKKFSLDFSKKVRKWTEEWDVSIKNLVLSCYQLLLHLVSDNERVSVVTNVSLRKENDDKRWFGPLEIFLPVVADFTQAPSNVVQFIKTTVEEVQMIVRQGLISFKEVKALCLDQTAIEFLFMHCVVYEDEVSREIANESLGIQPVELISVDSRFSSAVHVCTDKENRLFIEIQCLPDFADDTAAAEILNGLISLMESIINIDKLSLSQLKDGFKKRKKGSKISNQNKDSVTQKLNESSSDIYKHYEVTKETTKGWDHKVKLWISSNGTGKRLNWSTKNGSKNLDLNEPHDIKFTLQNGIKVISVATSKRKFIFKSGDSGVMEGIWCELEETVTSL